MKGVVFVVFALVAISLANANILKKPKIELFEIRENQKTKELQVEPVKLQFELESEEESLASKLSKILQYKKQKVDGVPRGLIKNFKTQKDSIVGKSKKRPVLLILSPDYLDGLDSRHNSEEDLKNSFLDETRTKTLMKPGSEVVFNIIAAKKARNAPKRPNKPLFLRNGIGIAYRTNSPRSRHGERPYVIDYSDEHY